jgi:hypothetical protein
MNSVITLTFGDCAENHKGMECIGSMVPEGDGFHLEDIQEIQSKMTEMGAFCELINLRQDHPEFPEAFVLIIRKKISCLFGDENTAQLFAEHILLDWDRKAFMYGRVVNKYARWNLCIVEISREQDGSCECGMVCGI